MSIVDADLTTLAFCWRLQRRDGVCLGFTTHDRDLRIGGITYLASPGMLPSAISMSDGFDADRLEVAGSLTSETISSSDMRAGRWDGASIAIFLINWEAPEGERIALVRGELGDVSVRSAGFTAELRGPTALLDRPVVEQTSPECRAELGDKRCRVDMAGRVRLTRVVEVADEVHVTVESAAEEAQAYAYGRLRWLSGRNSGLDGAVRSSSGTQLTLREAPFYPPSVGDLVEISEGCDKSFATCRSRFANSENFRGEPHLPGIDLLTRYSGA